jgi:hypothetical protein
VPTNVTHGTPGEAFSTQPCSGRSVRAAAWCTNDAKPLKLITRFCPRSSKSVAHRRATSVPFGKVRIGAFASSDARQARRRSNRSDGGAPRQLEHWNIPYLAALVNDDPPIGHRVRHLCITASLARRASHDPPSSIDDRDPFTPPRIHALPGLFRADEWRSRADERPTRARELARSLDVLPSASQRQRTSGCHDKHSTNRASSRCRACDSVDVI